LIKEHVWNNPQMMNDYNPVPEDFEWNKEGEWP